MASTLAVLSFWLASAYAQTQAPTCDIGGVIGNGWGAGAISANNASEQVFYDRLQSPDASHSVTFNLTATQTQQGFQEWTWRVNITNVRTGDFNGSYRGSRSGSGELEDPHFVHVSYDLQWPAGGRIQDFLNETYVQSGTPVLGPGSLCPAIFDMSGLPFHISNRYQESDNGDCTGVFGEDCVAAMLNSSAQWTYYGSSSEGCPLPGNSFTELPACQSIFNTTDYPGRLCSAFSPGPLGNTTRSLPIAYPSGDIRPLSSGETFFFNTKRETNGTNETLYYNANQQLQVMVLSGLPGTRQMLCQRVNTTDAPTSSAARNTGATITKMLSGFGLVVLFSLL